MHASAKLGRMNLQFTTLNITPASTMRLKYKINGGLKLHDTKIFALPTVTDIA